MNELDLPEGELRFELTDPECGELYTTFDLAWPAGLQEGRTPPVALLVNEEAKIYNIAQRHGFRYFTELEDFKQYVQQAILAA